jgi:hypothetical protein
MRRCTSGPKPSVRLLLVHVEQVLRVLRSAAAVAHAVEAAQVRCWPRPGRSGSRPGSPARCAAAAPRPASAPSFSSSASAGAHRGVHVGVEAGRGRTRRAGRCAGPCQRLAAVAGARMSPMAVRHGLLQRWWRRARRNPLMADSSRAQSSAERAIGPAWSRRGSEGDHPVARAAPVGGLDAGDAGEAGRLADRAAGVGAGGRRQQARGHRRRAAARRAAGHPARVPGVVDRAVGAVLVGRAHRELVAVQLAQADRAGLGQARHHGGVEGAAVALEHAGCRRWSACAAVTKMSLCAKGTPSSGAASPAARRASAAAAAAAGTVGVAPAKRRPVAAAGQRPAGASTQSTARHLRRPPAGSAPRPRRVHAGLELIRSPSAPGTGRPPRPGRRRWLARALIALGHRVLAQAQAAPPGRPTAACTAARTPRVSTAPICLHDARRSRSAGSAAWPAARRLEGQPRELREAGHIVKVQGHDGVRKGQCGEHVRRVFPTAAHRAVGYYLCPLIQQGPRPSIQRGRA